MFFYEVVSAFSLVLVVLHKRHPYRASFLLNLKVREELFNFCFVRIRLHCSIRCQYTDAGRLRMPAIDLCCWTNDAKHSCRWTQSLQIVSLKAAQSLCRCGVAGKNNERTVLFQQPFHAL